MESESRNFRFVCVSDTHGLTDKLEIPPGDVLIHAGDFSNVGEPEIVAEFNEWLGKLPHPTKIVIAGNHDISFDIENYPNLKTSFHRDLPPIDPKKTKSLLTNCTYLEDSYTMVHGYKVYGSPWTPYFFGWAFNAQRGKEIAKIWEKIPKDTDILVTHGPPYGILDLAAHGEHTGCEELIKKIEKIKPLYHIFGHIHEGHGREERKGTTFINASTCTVGYQPTNGPIVFELPAKKEGATQKEEGDASKCNLF